MADIFSVPDFFADGTILPDDFGFGLQFSGTTGRSATNNNPLNLEYRPDSYQDKYGAEMEPVSKSGKQRFAKFPSMEAGYNAGLDQIRLDQSRGHTLASFVNKFAPPHENPTGQIIQQYANALGVFPDTPISQIPPEKLIVPMLARESSTRIVSDKEQEIYAKLKNPGQRGKKPFKEYQIASTGNKIPGPSETFDVSNTFDVSDVEPPEVFDVSGVDPNMAAPKGPIIKAEPPNKPLDQSALPLKEFDPASFKTLVEASSVDKPENKIKAYAKARFPDLPVEESVKRYWVDRDNNISFIDDQGKIRREVPGGILGTAKKIAADMIGHPLETGIGGLGLTLGGPFGASLGTAGGGALRKGINALTGAESTTLSEVVGNAAADFLGTGLTTGPLHRGPITGANKIINRTSAGSPGQVTFKDLAPVRELDQQIGGAINRELDAISPATAGSGKIAQGAAREIKEGLHQAREAAVSPQYKAAFKTGIEVDIQPVLDEIEIMRKMYNPSSPRTAALNKIERYLTKTDIDPDTLETITIPEKSLERLHNAKIDIDDLLKIPKENDGAVPNTIRRNVVNLKDRLTELMTDASPEYKQAMEDFRALSGPMNKFKYGDPNIKIADRKPGSKSLIAKIEELGTTDAAEKAPDLIFSDRPESISKARQWYQINHPDEWNSLMRNRLQRKLDLIKGSTAEGQTGYKFKESVFGSPAEQDKWRAALSPDQYKQLSKFMDVLDETRKIKFTAEEATRGSRYYIRAAAGSSLSGALSIVDYINPFTHLGNWFDKIRNKKYTAALSEALLDPNQINKLSKINLISDKVKRAAEVAGFLDSIWMESEGKERYYKSTSRTVPRNQPNTGTE